MNAKIVRRAWLTNPRDIIQLANKQATGHGTGKRDREGAKRRHPANAADVRGRFPQPRVTSSLKNTRAAISLSASWMSSPSKYITSMYMRTACWRPGMVFVIKPPRKHHCMNIAKRRR
jgi:hypothetical protein